MKNSAISILSTFSKQEINSFGEFLSSPFHNKNNKAVRLFELLRKYHPDYASKALTKEDLFRKLYGDTKYRESYVRNLFSDLKILLENFLIHSSISTKRGKNKILIEELSARELNSLLDRKIDMFEKETDNVKLKDQEYYSDKLFVYEMKSFSTVDKTLYDNFRKDQISSVIRYFLICLMESSFQLAVEEQRVQISHDFGFLKHVLNYVKNDPEEFESVPLLMIFYHLWMGILEDGSDEHFMNARKIFKANFYILTQPDKKNIYSVMQVYYAKKIQAGEFSYNRKLLDLLLEMLEYNVISHNKTNFINLNLYRNILILCFKLNETSKLKRFTDEFLNLVSPESKDTVSAYSSAHLNFMEGKYEEALMMSQKVNFRDLLISTNENLYFKLDMKTLVMKCLYELGSFENLISHLETFRQFLNNSKIIKESSRKNNLFLINSVRELLKINLEYDDFSLKELKKKANASKENSGSDWLLTKVNELEKKERKVK